MNWKSLRWRSWFVVAGIKDIHGAPVGDTIVLANNSEVEALSGFRKIQPQVYAGLFPVSSDDFENFRDALSKLTLNDASLYYEPENSDALGFGFRCGFLECCIWKLFKRDSKESTTYL